MQRKTRLSTAIVDTGLDPIREHKASATRISTTHHIKETLRQQNRNHSYSYLEYSEDESKLIEYKYDPADRKASPQYILILERPLSGRGQSGFAGIYEEYTLDGKKTGRKRVIKEDPAHACVLEASASFAKRLIPKGLEGCVNFADASKWNIANPEHQQTQEEREGEQAGAKNSVSITAKQSVSTIGRGKGKTIGISFRKAKTVKKEPIQTGEEKAITVQPALIGYQPWAELITGDKREAKTWRSYEMVNKALILKSIKTMTPYAKNQLAAAIYLSEVVGDESLHVGQFMVQGTKDGITSVVRLDFGARERYAALRHEKKDYRAGETSRAYTSRPFSQAGNNYISYLLADPEIHAKYLQLWAREHDDPELSPEKLAAENVKKVKEQLDNIPGHQRISAIAEIASTLKIKTKVNNELEVLKKLEESTKARIEHMRNENVIKVLHKLNHLLDSLSIAPVSARKGHWINLKPHQKHDKELALNFSNLYDNAQFYALLNALKTNQDKSPSKVGEILFHLEANLEFNMKTNDEDMTQKLEIIRKMKMNLQARQDAVSELKDYLTVLKRGSSLFCSHYVKPTMTGLIKESYYVKHKIQLIEEAIHKFKEGENIYSILNNSFLNAIKNNVSNNSNKPEERVDRLKDCVRCFTSIDDILQYNDTTVSTRLRSNSVFGRK